MATGVALPVSHFDVGGETVVDGLKGHLYGDRGVWRPGDSIYLTFALQDRTQDAARRTTRSRSSCAIRAASWCRR